MTGVELNVIQDLTSARNHNTELRNELENLIKLRVKLELDFNVLQKTAIRLQDININIIILI